VNVRDRSWRRAPPAPGTVLHAWLADRGSLTARLVAASRVFAVRLLRQSLARPHPDEASAIGAPRRERVVTREVLLVCDGRPVVFAHSIVRRRHLRGAWRSLGALGARPLGAALFADPRVARHPLAFRRLGTGHPLYCAVARALARTPGELWARRSLFVFERAPLLVTEVFLPEILKRTRRKNTEPRP